jgi:hypothetical protein
MTTNNAQARAARLTAILADAQRVDLAGRDAVLDYVHRLQAEGVAVLPVVKGGKEPATDRGVHAATVDPATFDRMYAEGMNLGVNLGASNLVVVDADTPDEVAGLTSWWKLRHPDDDLPAPTTRTPGTPTHHSNGGHWWVVDADGTTAGLSNVKLGLGGDRSATAMVGSRYVLLPGSVRDEVADPDHPEYRTTGTVAGASVAEGVVGWIKATQAVRRATTTDYAGEGTDIDEWKGVTPWSDILGPGLGWNFVEGASPCGCERWLRDGSDKWLFVFQSASTTPRSPPEWIRDLKM